MDYILNNLPEQGYIKTVQHQGSPLHIFEGNMAYAEVHMNGAEFPVYVKTRVPSWTK